MKTKSKKIAYAALAGAGSLLMARSAAQAALTVTWTETSGISTQAGTMDRYVFKVTGFTGTDTTVGGLGQDPEVLLFEGTWSDTGGSILVPGAASAAGVWTGYIASAPSAAVAEPSTADKSSSVNLPSLFSTASRSGTGSATTTTSGGVTGINGTSSSFTAHWYQSNPGTSAGPAGGIEPSVNGGKLATLFVTPGTSIQFSGDFGSYGPGTNSNGTTNFSLTTAAVSSGNNIISLTSTAPTNTAPTAYGANSLGTVTATGTGASYKAGTLVLGTATGTGFVNGVLSGTPSTPTEIYALDIENAAGGTGVPSDLAAIVSAMNTQLGAGGSASLTPPSSNPFPAGPAGTPGYDVYITLNGLTQAQLSSDFLGFDLTEGASFSTDKVAAVALVPEPTSAAFLLVGASGMLMGRRRRNASQTA
jgi:hypothetical protein